MVASQSSNTAHGQVFLLRPVLASGLVFHIAIDLGSLHYQAAAQIIGDEAGYHARYFPAIIKIVAGNWW
jgi:hypothetical protein